MSDIVERLRQRFDYLTCQDPVKLCKEAADEIERLRTELSRSQYIYIGKDGKPVLARELEDERDALRARLAEAEKVIEPFLDRRVAELTAGDFRAARAWKEANNG